jgi:hypothetical protein
MAHHGRDAGRRETARYFADKGARKRLARITIRNSTPAWFWVYVVIAIAFLALAVPWIARQHEKQHRRAPTNQTAPASRR